MIGNSSARPAFIVSFDCEGHWGLMDHLEAHGRLTSADLAYAYERLLALLDRHQVRATFAFVGAFAMSEDEARANLPLFTEVGPRAREWLSPFMADLQTRRTDAWFAPRAAAAVTASGRHELASHGFTHLPLVEDKIDAAEFEREMTSARIPEAYARAKELTFVYPRNQLGFVHELGRHGFIGYRDALAVRKGQRSSRWRHLYNEVNPFPSSQAQDGAAAAVVRIPAGRMLNWRSGLRSRIPIAWTARLWRETITDALLNGGVAHVWSHPHNFITGRGMFDLLDEVLKAAGPRIRSGELWNPTMREYALARRGTGPTS